MRAPAQIRAKPKRTTVTVIEDIFILLCIPVLWPTIMGWQAPIYALLRVVALAGLIWIFVRRVRAIRAQRPDRNSIESN